MASSMTRSMYPSDRPHYSDPNFGSHHTFPSRDHHHLASPDFMQPSSPQLNSSDAILSQGSPPGPSNARRRYTCQTCDKGFTTSGHLARHSRVHTGERNHKCPFPGCETRCSRQDNLQQHYKIHLSPGSRRTSGSATRAAMTRAQSASQLRNTARSNQQRRRRSTTPPPSIYPASTPTPPDTPPLLAEARLPAPPHANSTTIHWSASPDMSTHAPYGSSHTGTYSSGDQPQSSHLVFHPARCHTSNPGDGPQYRHSPPWQYRNESPSSSQEQQLSSSYSGYDVEQAPSPASSTSSRGSVQVQDISTYPAYAFSGQCRLQQPAPASIPTCHYSHPANSKTNSNDGRNDPQQPPHNFQAASPANTGTLISQRSTAHISHPLSPASGRSGSTELSQPPTPTYPGCSADSSGLTPVFSSHSLGYPPQSENQGPSVRHQNHPIEMDSQVRESHFPTLHPVAQPHSYSYFQSQGYHNSHSDVSSTQNRQMSPPPILAPIQNERLTRDEHDLSSFQHRALHRSHSEAFKVLSPVSHRQSQAIAPTERDGPSSAGLSADMPHLHFSHYTPTHQSQSQQVSSQDYANPYMNISPDHPHDDRAWRVGAVTAIGHHVIYTGHDRGAARGHAGSLAKPLASPY